MRIPGNVANYFSKPNLDNAVYRVNNSTNIGTKKTEKHDKADVSPMGKIAKLVEKLMKQKQEVIERKKEYINTAIEKKYTFDMMKDRIKIYDEQLRELDKQLADAFKQATELEENDENEDPQKKVSEKAAAENADTQGKIEQVLKERGFQPANESLFSSIVKTEAKMELATKERGVIQRAKVSLDTEKGFIRSNDKLLNRLEDSVDRSINIMLSTAIGVNDVVNVAKSSNATKRDTVDDISKTQKTVLSEKLTGDEIKTQETHSQEAPATEVQPTEASATEVLPTK